MTATSPVDILPDLNRPTVTVFTEAEGLATEEVETQVTFPIESVMNGASGVERVRSISSSGLSIVFVEFDWNQDIYIARQIVSEKLQAATLPSGIESKLGPISSIMGEIQLIGLTSKEGKTSPGELRSYADWTLKPKIQTVSGVASSTVLGGAIQEYRVDIDLSRLNSVGISVTDLATTLEGISTNKSGGFLSTNTLEYPIRILGRTNQVEVLENTPILRNGGAIILLKDVATVSVGSQLNPRGDAGINAKPAVLISITKQPGENTLELTKRVDALLSQVSGTLDEDIELHTDLFKQEKFIATGIENLAEITRDAAILVAIVLILFLGNWRPVAITLFALPFSFVLSILILHWFGIAINVMTLGGLAVAIGELTDDAVVDVENTIRWLREKGGGKSAFSVREIVLQSSSEVRGSIIFSTILIVLVFLPLLGLSNIEGKLLAPLAIAYIVALLASTVVAMTVTVVMSYYLLPNAKTVRENKETRTALFFQALARPFILWSVRKPLFGLVVAGVSTVITIGLIMQAGKDFLPPFNEGSLTIGLSLEPGSSLEQSLSIAQQVEKAILDSEGVQSVARRTGRAEEDEHANGINVSEFEVNVDLAAVPKNDIIESIKEELSQVDLNGANVSIGQPISHRIEHILSGVRAPLVIKVFGPDLEKLEEYGDRIRVLLSDIPGTLNPVLEQEVSIPQISITPNREQVARAGFTLDEFSEVLEVAMGGRKLGSIVDDNRTFRLTLRVQSIQSIQAESIRTLILTTPSGARVSLSSLAEVKLTEGRNSISRDNSQRRIVVSSGILDGDSVTIIETLKERIASSLDLPQDYYISYEGTYKSQQESSQSLLWLTMISVIGIIGALYYKFRSFSFVFQVLINVPVTYVGAMIAIAMTGNVISLASLVGLISLLGIAARNGILLIEHWLFRATEEGIPFSEELIVEGSLNRLTPMLITSLSTIFALVPMLFAADQPGLEILYPISVATFGGLVTSTIVEILIRPGMFALMGKKPLERAVERFHANGEPT